MDTQINTTMNRLRTPPRSPRNFDKIFFDEDYKTEEKCNIHIVEIYTMNKRIDKLNSELEAKIKNETVMKKQIEELEFNSNSKITGLLKDVDEQKYLISDLLAKNKILEKSHNYNELIEYYENKFEEAQNKYHKNFQIFSGMINKLTTGGYNLDVYKNLIKKYEEKILELEKMVEDKNKNERKINSRQKFFEKYCFKAEEKIEHFSKVSKKFYDQEKMINKLKSEIESNNEEIKLVKEENNLLNKELENLKSENENIKNFVDKIKPILKVNWEDIKKNNESNYENLFASSRNEETKDNNNSKNIMILIDNLNTFLHVLRDSVDNIPDLSGVIKIINDIRGYIEMLLNKIQMMSVNQYNVINTCCELNDKVRAFLKNNKVSIDFLGILKDIRNICTKMLFDYNPK